MLASSVVFIAIIINLQLTDAAKIPNNDHYISYPDPVQYNLDNAIHESCKDLNYCTIKPVNYPEEKINQILQKHTLIPLLAPSEELTRQKRMSVDDDDYVFPCESEVMYHRLYAVKQETEDRGSSWRTVIQSPDKNLNQMVRVEICKNVEASCFQDNLLPQYVCIQLYTPREVTVINKDNEVEQITTKIPSSCSCALRKSLILN